MPHLNRTKSGHAVDENRKSPNKASKLKKCITAANRKYSSKAQDRLAGGADAPEEKEDEPQIAVTEESKVITETTEAITKTEDGIPVRTAGPCCTCLASIPGSTGDKKVDEIIDYVHQNLQDAGKALATLGENFEHESKLMFADVLGRIQQWIGIVQNKLDICEKELEALRKELIARACEIENLKKLLGECEEREASCVNEISALLSFKKATQTELRSRIAKQEEQVKEAKEVKEVKEVQEDPRKEEVEIAKEVAPRKFDAFEMDEDDRDRDRSREKIEIICTDAAIQSMMKDKDRLRREMELEAEIARLRKENERIIKERAEYENAIQRALLRGVSCLNVEALRVLRCPPIPCCTPCAPCPASIMESTMTCRKNGAASSRPKSCVTQRAGSGRAHEQCCLTAKRPCASACCSGGKGRKSPSDNSMVFLLHQGDAENVCNMNDASMPRVCGAPAMKKIEIPPCPRFGK
ncbi:uncharacterized protein LOC108625188 [Ceratina calcarata]|uniref:Uncharacterized protein LOC108625188 n=1 Tax=Ceratina calcarata TaxID=156304 RepID=A0AAJ7N6U6_9HYME|nr:uncharacterized protein LOC108625188 [Ceratina calcarata]